MAKRFIGKAVREKKIRFSKPSFQTVHKVEKVNEPIKTVIVEEEKNNGIIEINDMMDINKVEDMLNINGQEVKAPKRKVKYEKKERGLIEHTENSQIVINEDNKMLLND